MLVDLLTKAASIRDIEVVKRYSKISDSLLDDCWDLKEGVMIIKSVINLLYLFIYLSSYLSIYLYLSICLSISGGEGGASQEAYTRVLFMMHSRSVASP